MKCLEKNYNKYAIVRRRKPRALRLSFDFILFLVPFLFWLTFYAHFEDIVNGMADYFRTGALEIDFSRTLILITLLINILQTAKLDLKITVKNQFFAALFAIVFYEFTILIATNIGVITGIRAYYFGAAGTYDNTLSLFILASFAVMQALRFLFLKIDIWVLHAIKEFNKATNEIINFVFVPKKFIFFILATLALMLFLLIANYWIENSKIPKLNYEQFGGPRGHYYDCCYQACKPKNCSSDGLGYGSSRSLDAEAEANIFRGKWIWIFAFAAGLFTLWARLISKEQIKQVWKQIEQTQEQINDAREETRQQNRITNSQLKLAKKQIEQTNESLKISKDTVINERFMKAVEMLGSESLSIRVNGCSSLMWIAMDYKDMKNQCLRMLFTFINNPYLDSDEKQLKKDLEIDDYKDGKVFEEIFPKDKELRVDIQEAADSFSRIYEKYENEDLDKIPIKLPQYFLLNRRKHPISLFGANLRGINLHDIWLIGGNIKKSKFLGSGLVNANFSHADLHEANFMSANLEGANFDGATLTNAKMARAKIIAASLELAELDGANLFRSNLEKSSLEDASLESATLALANLRNCNLRDADFESANLIKSNLDNSNLDSANLAKANLENANMQGANLTYADLKNAKNLTKEQILSAKWIKSSEFDGPPELPDRLLKDKDIKKWLDNPSFEETEETENDDEDD